VEQRNDVEHTSLEVGRGVLSTFAMGVDLTDASGGGVLCADEEVGRGACTVGEGRGSSTARVGMGGNFEVVYDGGMMRSCGRQEG
jgi:hypothetical protein